MSLIRCGAHGFQPGLVGMTSLSSLVVIDPSPPRHMKFPRDLSAMQSLLSVDVGCREIPIPLGTLPSLRHLTLRGLRPSCRGSHDAERASCSVLVSMKRLHGLPQAVLMLLSYSVFTALPGHNIKLTGDFS